MIKTNELRIGNLVFLNDKQKVWEILEGFDIDEMTENSTVDPIVLTEEWLSKAGFEKSFTNDFWYSIKIGDKRLLVSTLGNIEIEKWDRTMIAFPNICKYVHQLQNLYFALCGEELVFSSTEP